MFVPHPVVLADTEVYFSISGEMGLSNFVYPDEWIQLLQSSKRAVGAAGRKAKVCWGLLSQLDQSCTVSGTGALLGHISYCCPSYTEVVDV